eukprot:CAMPEP_0201575932 /NCGR_PEP_ID=MMETSP0190_2-20130828/21376_1 /ASSEMBLY_ACC=CAM_ASM_000263 /TAXON_ID=37353 /ORGANISM="Rosalina sp." /LENGTH=670 /DNA_ID=CAMNT_0048006147 /DNA_START=227 /DNA_END=2239 /DNA_ORIENTATION=+
MEGEWTNRTKDTLDCVFALPTPGTIMNVTLHIGQDRILTTAIVSKEDAQELVQQIQANNPDADDKKTSSNNYQSVDATHITPEEANPYEQYVPDLFRLPFGNVAPGDTISLKCEYIEPLDYYKKGYIVSLPLYFPPGTMIESAPWDQVVHVECKINALTPNSKIDCWTHHIKTKAEENGKGIVTVKSGACKELEEKNQYMQPNRNQHDPNISRTGRDFELSYSVKSEKTMAHCIQETDIEDPNSGSLCLFITPPATLNTTFGRAFFFLLDRSGSMVGEPFREATRALNRALDRLRPSDQFNVCAFDHRQVYYQPSLVPANKEMLTNCKTWITTYVPERGGTTMDAPINYALEQLEKSDLLPFVVLITDGAVQNEREICEKIEQNKKMRTRFLTLGIGSYCNWFFLKMLSKLGRGFSDIVVYRERIYHKMDHLLRMANTPVLTDIEVGLKGDEIEIYPFPIPDLFIGAPVVIAARYSSTECPKKIAIRGFNPHGDQETIQCKVERRNDLPVEKIFIKQQIDLMTADAWLKKSKKLENKVIDVSVHSNMPSMFTDVVMFETTQLLFEEEEKKLDQLINDNDDPDANTRHRRDRLMAKVKNNKKTVAALAVGGTAAIVAVGVMSFGDVQATMDNIPILGGGGDLDIDIDGCCDDCNCGDCDCDLDCDCDCVIM